MDDENVKPAPVDRGAEVKAMGKLADAMADLDPDAIGRVLRWAVDAYNVEVRGAGGKGGTGRVAGAGGAGGDTSQGQGTNGVPQFTSLAELHAATSPESDADKTLVGAYWAQFGEGKSEFGSQEINAALKNLGHRIANITTAFDTLKARKPAAVMQLKKSGTSRQARKTYRLTLAGKSAVEAMVSQD